MNTVTKLKAFEFETCLHVEINKFERQYLYCSRDLKIIKTKLVVFVPGYWFSKSMMVWSQLRDIFICFVIESDKTFHIEDQYRLSS